MCRITRDFAEIPSYGHPNIDGTLSGLIGVMEPVHHMDVMNMAVLSCNVHPRSSISRPITCDSSGCCIKDITFNTSVGVSFSSC